VKIDNGRVVVSPFVKIRISHKTCFEIIVSITHLGLQKSYRELFPGFRGDLWRGVKYGEWW
jgi:hypothetical protein